MQLDKHRKQPLIQGLSSESMWRNTAPPLLELFVRRNTPLDAPLLPVNSLEQLHGALRMLHQEQALLRHVLDTPSLHDRFLSFAQDVCQTPSGSSLANAVQTAGHDNLGVFVLMQALENIAETPTQCSVCFVALQRGRFLELTAAALDLHDEHRRMLFLTGLLATLSPLFAASARDVLLHLVPDVSIAELLHEPDETSALLFSLLFAIEDGDFDHVAELLTRTSITGEQAALLYGRAAVWTRRVLGSPGG